jgi:hypothetical protein
VKKKKVVWSKKIVALLCSPLFFAASCAGGALLWAGPLESVGARDMARGERPDLRMMVIATVPDPAAPGARRVEQVMLSVLPRFKEKNPGYSLLPPQPEGRVENPLADMVTDYLATPAAEGTLVETHFRHEMLSVRARYIATPGDVKPLYTRAGSVVDALLAGLGLACLLAMAGRFLKYSIQYRESRGRFD